MPSKRAVAALFFSQLLAGIAFAQTIVLPPPAAADASVSSSIEFGRVSGGEIELITKHSRKFSGSLGFGLSRSSQLPFANAGTGTNLNATLGGTIVEDRLWFFASAHKDDGLLAQRYASTMPQLQSATTRGTDVNLRAQLGDRQSFAASFAAGRELGATTIPMAATAPLPTSFLSLHYTGIVSSNMFFTANFSRGSVTQRALSFVPVVQPQ